MEEASGLQRIIEQVAILRPLEKGVSAGDWKGASERTPQVPLDSVHFPHWHLPRKEQACWVWLVTGLSPADRRIVNHVSLHSDVRVVTEYCEEGTHWGRL